MYFSGVSFSFSFLYLCVSLFSVIKEKDDSYLGSDFISIKKRLDLLVYEVVINFFFRPNQESLEEGTIPTILTSLKKTYIEMTFLSFTTVE